MLHVVERCGGLQPAAPRPSGDIGNRTFSRQLLTDVILVLSRLAFLFCVFLVMFHVQRCCSDHRESFRVALHLHTSTSRVVYVSALTLRLNQRLPSN